MDYDAEKVWKWISDYWEEPRTCPICKSPDQFVLLRRVWELREFHGGGLVIGEGPVLPVIGLMCDVCGHIIIFNAIAVRAVPKSVGEGK